MLNYSYLSVTTTSYVATKHVSIKNKNITNNSLKFPHCKSLYEIIVILIVLSIFFKIHVLIEKHKLLNNKNVIF